METFGNKNCNKESLKDSSYKVIEKMVSLLKNKLQQLLDSYSAFKVWFNNLSRKYKILVITLIVLVKLLGSAIFTYILYIFLYK